MNAAADAADVTISPATSGAEWQPVTAEDRVIAVMKASRDVQQAQAQALVALVTQSVPLPDHVGTLIDVRA